MSTVPAKHQLVPGGGSETARTARSLQLPRGSCAVGPTDSSCVCLHFSSPGNPSSPPQGQAQKGKQRGRRDFALRNVARKVSTT